MTTGERIVEAMVNHRFRGLNAGDIAYSAGLAESTVRRWLPRLQRAGLVREVGIHGWWTATTPITRPPTGLSI